MHRRKIIVLDDEETLRIVCAKELRRQGYDAFPECSKAKGYDWSVVNKPDLMISDIKSPEMDGFELIKWIKASPYTTHIPFVFVTGYADLKNAIEAKKLGAADFISKPYDLPDLLQAIERILVQEYQPAKHISDEDLFQTYGIGLTKYRPWPELESRFRDLLERQGRRTTFFETEANWRTHFLIEAGRRIFGGFFLRPFCLHGGVFEEIFSLREYLDGRGINSGLLYSLAVDSSISRELAGLLGIRIVPADVIAAWLSTPDVLESTDPLVHPRYGSLAPNDPDKAFLEFSGKFFESVDQFDGSIYSIPWNPMGSDKPDRIEVVQHQGWLHGLRFENKELDHRIYVSGEALWLACTRLWLAAGYRKGDLTLRGEEDDLLFQVLCRLSLLRRDGEVLFLNRYQ